MALGARATAHLSSLQLCSPLPTHCCFGPCRAATGVEERRGAGKVSSEGCGGTLESTIFGGTLLLSPLLLTPPSALGVQLTTALLGSLPPFRCCLQWDPVEETPTGTPLTRQQWGAPSQSNCLLAPAHPSISLLLDYAGICPRVLQTRPSSLSALLKHISPSPACQGTYDMLAALFKEFLTTVLFQCHSLLSCRCCRMFHGPLDGPGPCFRIWGFGAPTALFQAFRVSAEVKIASAPL